MRGEKREVELRDVVMMLELLAWLERPSFVSAAFASRLMSLCFSETK